MRTDIDSISRNRIVSETDKNFFVEAGAGSGKTTMLVNRMVAMVENGIDISRISAITFTKAAAGEFYERFQKLLIKRSNPNYKYVDEGFAGQLPKPTDETRKNCAEALKNIDLCFMGTIDSFCNMVLSEHPSEAGIPSDARVIEDDELEAILKQEYVKLTGGQYGRELEKLARAFSGMQFNGEETFVKGMNILLNNRNVHFNFEPAPEFDIDKDFKAARSAIIDLIDNVEAHPDIVYADNQKSPAAAEELKKRAYILRGRWSSNTAGVINALKKLKELCIKKDYADLCSMDDSLLVKKQRYFALDIDDEDGILRKLKKLQYGVSMEFLAKSVPVVEQVMHDTGNLTFFDYLYYLRNMLKDDAEHDGKLIRYIYDRHSYFLIDEFQDTNPMQAEVFFYLTAKNPTPDWMKCDPADGSIFIVGDPKQSIYRFRGADVSSFINVRKLFEAGVGDVLKLTRNFRSTRKVCEYFNSTFSNLLPKDTESQSRFEPIPVTDMSESDVFQGTFYYNCYEGDRGRAEHPDMHDEDLIVKMIREFVGNPKYQIIPGDSKEPRTITYKDIMIINPSKTRMDRYIKALDEAGMPVKVEGKIPFETNKALKTMYALYGALSDTNDKIALNRALKVILYGYNDNLMAAYKSTGRKITLAPVSYDKELGELDEKLAGLDETLETLRHLADKAKSLSPAALYVQIMDSFEIFKQVPADNLEVVYYTLELIRVNEHDGSIVSLKDGAEFVKNLISGGSGQERCLSLTDDADCIHMANLHKIKGLEAPIVILPYAWTFQNTPSLYIDHLSDPAEGYIFNVSQEGDNKGSWTLFETSEYDEKKEIEKACKKDEIDRYVYVAATRARNALIACRSTIVKANGEQMTSGWKPLFDGMEDIMPLITGNANIPVRVSEDMLASKLYKDEKEDNSLKDRKSESPSYTIKNPSHTVIRSKMEDDNVESSEKDIPENTTSSEGKKDEWNVHKIPALIGTMTHRLMEKIISSKNTINKAYAVDEIIREYRMPIYASFEEDIRKALIKVCEVLDNGGYEQINNAPTDIIDTLLNADEVFCEVPYCYKEENELWNGVMDVIYKEGSKWHILDYKTNADGSDLDIKYQGQLDAYIKAFKVMTGEDADAFTYHIDI